MTLLRWLLDCTPFADRWHCIAGDRVLGAWLIAPNAITALAYFGMFVPLWTLYRAHRAAFGAAWLLAGSATFIALCGGHHALYVAGFWFPAYRLTALDDNLMAAASALMCGSFYAARRALCRLRPVAEVEAERDAKVAALAASEAARAGADAANRALQEQYVAVANVVSDLRAKVGVYEARYGRDRTHAELDEMLRVLVEAVPGAGGGGDARTG